MGNEKNRNDQVRVVARIRPINGADENNYWNISGKDCAISDDKNTFKFDNVYHGSQSTKHIYDDSIRDMIPDIVKNGINGIIMAYGQTSSGKTYTMQGKSDGSKPGIVQLVADQIFSEIANTPENRFTIQVSCFEVYNEQIRDLLDIDNPGDLKINRKNPLRPYVQSFDYLVSSRDELVGYLLEGNKNRAVDSTCVNGHSSRSHCISRIVIENQSEEGVLQSELTLVDLAGSESSKYMDVIPLQKTQREGSNINKSLLALSNVINCLEDEKKTVITYRDSKLTAALQYSLNRNAKLYIICCAKPTKKFATETRNTFRFAEKAQKVKVAVKSNTVKDSDESIILFLRTELKKCRERLSELKQESQSRKQTFSEEEEEEICEQINQYESYFLPKWKMDTQPQIPLPSFINEDSDKVLQKPDKYTDFTMIPTRVPSDDEHSLGRNMSTRTISTAATEGTVNHTTHNGRNGRMNQEDDDEEENQLEANLIQKEQWKCCPTLPRFWESKTNTQNVQT